MGMNRVFIAQPRLDAWLASGKADLFGEELSLRGPGRRFRLVEAVHVVSEVSGAPDPLELVGRVKSVPFLLELGAELLGDSMVVADNAFQVVPGWLAAPLGTFEEYRVRRGSRPVRAANDDELLVEFCAESS